MTTAQETLRDTKDPFIKCLNRRGYMPIVMPRGGLVPPTVYVLEEDRYILIRSLSAMLADQPEMLAKMHTDPVPTTDLERELATKRGGKVSIGFLGGILSKMGLGGDPKFEASADSGYDARFEFSGVELRSVEPGLVLELVAKLRPNAFGEEALKKGQIHIAYEYLYARKLSIGAENKRELDLSAGVKINNAVDVGVNSNASRTSGEIESYTGGNPLAFAFKVGKLSRVNGEYDLEWRVKEGAGLVANEEQETYLSHTGMFYEIDNLG